MPRRTTFVRRESYSRGRLQSKVLETSVDFAIEKGIAKYFFTNLCSHRFVKKYFTMPFSIAKSTMVSRTFDCKKPRLYDSRRTKVVRRGDFGN